jgi:hypothetical protein
MRRTVLGTLAALLFAGCAPTLFFNQSFLTAEELKLARNGYASLKSTGETFDLSPIKAQEPNAGDRVAILKMHGAYLAVGDGFTHAWRLWPGGKDEAHYKPVELNPGAKGFGSPSLEASGNCALIRWQRSGAPAQAFVTSGGDVNDKKCNE